MIGKQLKKRRLQEKITQKDLAALLKTTVSNISKWENDKSTPDEKTLAQLKKLWNMSFDETKKESSNTSKTQAKDKTVAVKETKAIEPKKKAQAKDKTVAVKEAKATESKKKAQAKDKTVAVKETKATEPKKKAQPKDKTVAVKETKATEPKKKVQPNQKKNSLGITDFKTLIENNMYYVDKTEHIETVKWSGVANIFTAPNGFGKSLFLSTLRYFFDITGDQSIFNGLNITKNTEFCEKYMGKHPVIFIDFNDILNDGTEFPTYHDLYNRLCQIVVKTAQQYSFLAKSPKLNEYDQEDYQRILNLVNDSVLFTMMLEDLTKLLYKHYGKRVVVLFDGYDTVLNVAEKYGYKEHMNDVMQSLCCSTFKDNNSLDLGVIVAEEYVVTASITSGFNNASIYDKESWLSRRIFPFTDEDVNSMVQYYHLEKDYPELKKSCKEYIGDEIIWHKAETDFVFSPLKVLSFCKKHCSKKK